MSTQVDGVGRMLPAREDVRGGPTAGPGMALAWSIQYLLLSLTARPRLRALIHGLCALSLFPIKYVDYVLLRGPGRRPRGQSL